MLRKKKITLITHPRPHIDDICGFWLLMRFWPPAKNARVKFISALESDPGKKDEIWIGVGRGRFDEHKGDVGESATSLVYRFIREERPDLKPEEIRALDRLVAWVRDEDTGLHDSEPDRDFSYAALLRSHFDLNRHDSEELTRFGLSLLDDLYQSISNETRLAEDWERRVEFESPWGRGVALETTAYGADDYAYRHGFVILVLLNPRRGFRAYRAEARSEVDLADAYNVLRRVEPKADWYLHHSKKMLLCGSDVAPETRMSKLNLNELMRVIQPVG